jgi:23S rRNA (cytidine1920-2'-O)/16S rRNA (cytidine1409-2'-O)-methyltransferase
MRNKMRLDNLLVERGLAESRTKAQALIMAGEVTVRGRASVKPGTPVDEQAEVTIVKPPLVVVVSSLTMRLANLGLACRLK